jgi:hypothetical protein
MWGPLAAADGIDRADLGVPQGRHLAAPPPASRECGQEDGPIAEVNSFGTAAGSQESVEDIAGDGLAALALRLSGKSLHSQAESLPDARMIERRFNALPLVQGRPVGEPSGDHLGSMGPFDVEDFPILEVFGNVVGHAVSRIGSLLIWVPHVVSNELQNEFRICRSREWAPGRGLARSFEISEIGGEGAERVGPHPCIGEVLQGGNISVS